jgi:four helix bundle protein
MRRAARCFQDVEVWRKAHDWVLSAYRFSDRFPKHELFGLTSQLQRAAVSIPANIAEGFRKQGRLDKIRFYNSAQGSLSECQYYLILAKDLGYGEDATLLDRLIEVDVMLDAYIRGIRGSSRVGEEVGK